MPSGSSGAGRAGRPPVARSPGARRRSVPTRRPAAGPPPSRPPRRGPARSRGLPAAAAGHRDPELLVGHAGRELARDPAFVDDEDAIGERLDLLQLERDEEDAATGVALLDEATVHVLDGADVQPARGLRGDEDTGVAVDLTGEHDLLLVASGEPRG